MAHRAAQIGGRPDSKRAPKASCTVADRLANRLAALHCNETDLLPGGKLRCPQCSRPRQCSECGSSMIIVMGTGEAGTVPYCASCCVAKGWIVGDIPESLVVFESCAKHTAAPNKVASTPRAVGASAARDGWMANYQADITTRLSKDKLASVRAAGWPFNVTESDEAVNPHCVMAAARAWAEAAMWRHVRSYVGRTSGASRKFLAVGVSPRQVASAVPTWIDYQPIGPNMPGCDGVTPHDVVRDSGHMWAVSASGDDYWNRLRRTLPTTVRGDFVCFYNTIYYVPNDVAKLLNAAVSRGVCVVATYMVLPRDNAHGTARAAMTYPLWPADKGPHMVEAVAVREGRSIDVLVAGNAGSYAHGSVPNHVVVGCEYAGMGWGKWSVKTVDDIGWPQNAVWCATGFGRLWVPYTVDITSDQGERQRTNAAALVKNTFFSTKPVPLELKPVALTDGDCQAAAAALCDALDTRPGVGNLVAEKLARSRVRYVSMLADTSVGWAVWAVLTGLLLGLTGLPYIPVGSSRFWSQAALSAAVAGSVWAWEGDYFVTGYSLLALLASTVPWGRAGRDARVGWLPGALAWAVIIVGLAVRFSSTGWAKYEVTETRWRTTKYLGSLQNLVYSTMNQVLAYFDLETMPVASLCDGLSECLCSVHEHYQMCSGVRWITPAEYVWLGIPKVWWPARTLKLFFITRSAHMLVALSAVAPGCAMSIAGFLPTAWPGGWFWCVVAVVGDVLSYRFVRFGPAVWVASRAVTVMLFSAFWFVTPPAEYTEAVVSGQPWPWFYAYCFPLLFCAYLLVPEMKPRVVMPSACAPAVIPGIDEGEYKATVGDSRRWIRVLRTQEQRLAMRKDKCLKSTLTVMLRSDGHLPPYFTYTNGVASALRSRYLCEAPAETTDALYRFTEFFDLISQDVVMTAEDCLDYLEEREGQFTGDKRERYQIVRQYLANQEYFGGTCDVASMRLKNGGFGAYMKGFTKTEASAHKVLGAVDDFLRDTVLQTETTWLGALSKLKPRMICFPDVVSQFDLRKLGLLFVQHGYIKKLLQSLWSFGLVPSPACDLASFQESVDEKMILLTPTADMESAFVDEVTAEFCALGHNPETVYRPHFLGSTFCSKLIMPCYRNGQPAWCFTIPFPRLVSRALVVGEVHGDTAAAILQDKIDNLMGICQGSAYQTRFLRICANFLDRLTQNRRREIVSDYERFYCSAGVYQPHPLETEFWAQLYGREALALSEELDEFERIMGAADVTLAYDDVYGVKTRLHPINIGRTCPLLSRWLMPGYSVDEAPDPRVLLSSVARAATASHPQACDLMLRVHRREPVFGGVKVTVKTRHQQRVGLAKNMEVARLLAEVDSLFLVVIGAGRDEVCEAALDGKRGVFCDFYDDLEFARLPAWWDDGGRAHARYAPGLHASAADPGEYVRLHPEDLTYYLHQLAEWQHPDHRYLAVFWCDANVPVDGELGLPWARVVELAAAFRDSRVLYCVKMQSSITWNHSCDWDITTTGGDYPFLFSSVYARPAGDSNPGVEVYAVGEDVPDLVESSDSQSMAVRAFALAVDCGLVDVIIDDTVSDARTDLEALASRMGLARLNQYYVLENDAAACDGSHQRGNAMLQRRLIEAMAELFPQLATDEVYGIVFGPVWAQGVVGHVASLAEKSSALYSGLPSTTLVNTLRFAFILASAMSRVTGRPLETVLRGSYLVGCVAGDDSLAIGRRV